MAKKTESAQTTVRRIRRKTRKKYSAEDKIRIVILMQVLPFYDEACMRAYQNFEQLIYMHLN